MQSNLLIFTAYIWENEIWYEGRVHVQPKIKKSRDEELWIGITDKFNKSNANL